MAFIGSSPTTQNFSPAIDYFNGDGVTIAFTLSRPVASVAQVQAVINNVPQNPADAYTVSGNTITFTSAPSSGTSNIYVYYTSPITQVVQPSIGTIGKTQLDIANLNGTGALQLPTGTTGQRPSGAAGLIRQNSTTGNPEWWDSTTSSWLQFSQPAGYTVNYLVVAGGGGGGNDIAGGGGAGGLLASSISLSSGVAYAITVGGGGAGGSSNGVNGASGSNSVIAGLATAIGGGAGAGIANSGVAGGSGGGSGSRASGGVGGAGTAGQGFAGGNRGSGVGVTTDQGGGGGGASAVGLGNTTSNTGGAGATSSITGSSVTYAGGGGGGGYGAFGAGGAGGGGAGSGTSAGTGTAGSANTGGGGGGGGFNYGNGAAGGSGIVIISYFGSQRGTGGTVTSSGGYTIHTFTSSSTYNA